MSSTCRHAPQSTRLHADARVRSTIPNWMQSVRAHNVEALLEVKGICLPPGLGRSALKHTPPPAPADICARRWCSASHVMIPLWRLLSACRCPQTSGAASSGSGTPGSTTRTSCGRRTRRRPPRRSSSRCADRCTPIALLYGLPECPSWTVIVHAPRPSVKDHDKQCKGPLPLTASHKR